MEQRCTYLQLEMNMMVSKKFTFVVVIYQDFGG